MITDEEGRTEQQLQMVQNLPDERKWALLRSDGNGPIGGPFDKPLRCFGCGIGWLSFILGFVFPVLWFYGAILYLRNYYLKDPRERAGLAAAAIAALICSVIVLITLLAILV